MRDRQLSFGLAGGGSNLSQKTRSTVTRITAKARRFLAWRYLATSRP